MFGNNHVTTDKERDELIDDIDKNQKGIYAHPHTSKEDKEETIRLMKEFIEKQRQR
ncbi:hypothetical protein [Bacillus sp. Cs-700]|uniref:hypothetical protein n=1 Tax=Bacillus sp. Cs-700 TaxID=2589818 RepID=UPI00140880EA|nr:hypothetical protein [Bacillus sp. Cs-700]